MSVSKRSIVQFILLQVAIAALGLWGISGIVQQYLLKQALMDAYRGNATEIQAQLGEFKSTFPKSSKREIMRLMDDVCASLECAVESVEISSVDDVHLNQEEIRVVAQAKPEDIPIVLEVFHRLPHLWSLTGLEVQGFEQPFRFQVRLQRELVQPNLIEWHPVVQSVFLSSMDEEQIATLLEWQAYKHYYEQSTNERAQLHQEWGRLYQSLNMPLWKLRSTPGKLTFTPSEGVRIQSLGEGGN